ncbi:MAG: Type III pantothenate kinase [Chloroflexi bacterium ADurb.Bin325]|nr:MAG: Type III pantothenate kinase [Chloroflexi bacterium ADurb.Bin325]
MLLAIDIGNTNITLGLYRQDMLVATWRLAAVHERMSDEYGILLTQLIAHRGFDPAEVREVAIASVVPTLTGTFRRVAVDYLRQEPLVVDAGVKTGVRIRYENPRDVGADRVVDCAAVQAKYGGPACVVDFGTATTFDGISRAGDYLGGAIAPGIGIAAEALFARASRLYRVEIAPPARAIGTNTAAAMQSGIFFGYVGLVEGLVARFRRELGDDMKVIATGGLAEVVAKETAVIQYVDPWLTLDGLRIIYRMNRA